MMSVADVHGAAHMVHALAQRSSLVRFVGEATAVFTTWGFAAFALLLAAAAIGQSAVLSRALLTAVLGAAASFGAAGLGLLLKAVVAEPRPCQIDAALAEAVRCPAQGNWSFPSNHSVFAGALAVTLVVVARTVERLWIAGAAVPIALAIGLSRIVLGVHYWWDVLAGLALGAAVAAGVIRGALPRVLHLLGRHGHRPPLYRPPGTT